MRPNAVVALNRAVAVAELDGPARGLAELDRTVDAATVSDYQPFHATRADLLARSGRTTEAIAAYDAAIERTGNAVERDFLIGRRAEAMAGGDGGAG